MFFFMNHNEHPQNERTYTIGREKGERNDCRSNQHHFCCRETERSQPQGPTISKELMEKARKEVEKCLKK